MTDLSQSQESDGGDDSNMFPNLYRTSMTMNFFFFFEFSMTMNYRIDNYDNNKL